MMFITMISATVLLSNNIRYEQTCICAAMMKLSLTKDYYLLCSKLVSVTQDGILV